MENLELFKQVLTASCYDESAWQFKDVRAEVILSSPVELSWKRKIKANASLRFWRFLKRRGYRMVRTKPFDLERRETGNDWPLFGYTMIGHRRLDNIESCIQSVLEQKVEGDIIETGVWRGGAMMYAKAVLNKYGANDRTIWCADSFEGLPRHYGRDAEMSVDPNLVGNTYLAVSQSEVEDNFRRFGLLDENVRFLKGWFSDTLLKAPIEKISIARLDGDLYESTMDALAALYPKISSGGYVIVDDYGSWKGCRVAVDEYREKYGITAPIRNIDEHGHYWQVP